MELRTCPGCRRLFHPDRNEKHCSRGCAIRSQRRRQHDKQVEKQLRRTLEGDP